MQLTFLENDDRNEIVEINQGILSILIEGVSLVVADFDVSVDIRNNGVAVPLIRDYLKTFDGKILHVKAISEANAKNNSIETPAYRINGVEVLALNENAIGSFRETLQREITNGVFNLLLNKGLDFSSLGVKVRVAPNQEQPFTANEQQFRFIADMGDGLKAHRAYMSWSHNEYFSSTCSSCQAGVANLHRGVEYIDHNLILPKAETKGTAKQYKLPSGPEVLVFDHHGLNHLAIDKETSPQNFIDWVAQMFIGAIEMAHVKQIQMRIGETVYSAEGTDD